jgi:hypothetical protein
MTMRTRRQKLRPSQKFGIRRTPRLDDMESSDLETRIQAFRENGRPLFITGLPVTCSEVIPPASVASRGATSPIGRPSAVATPAVATTVSTSLLHQMSASTVTTTVQVPSILDINISPPRRHRLPPPSNAHDKPATQLCHFVPPFQDMARYGYHDLPFMMYPPMTVPVLQQYQMGMMPRLGYNPTSVSQLPINNPWNIGLGITQQSTGASRQEVSTMPTTVHVSGTITN